MVNLKVENWEQCLSTLGAGHFTFPTRLQLARGEQAGGRQVQQHYCPLLSRQCGHRCPLLFQQSWSFRSNITGQVQLCDSDCRPWRPHTDGPPATGTTASQGNVFGEKIEEYFLGLHFETNNKIKKHLPVSFCRWSACARAQTSAGPTSVLRSLQRSRLRLQRQAKKHPYLCTVDIFILDEQLHIFV